MLEDTFDEKKSPSKPDTASRILQGLALAIVLVAAAVILWQLKGYQEGQKTYEELKGDYTAPLSQGEGENTAGQPPLLDIDFPALQAQNPEVMGWIDFDSIELSYPVLWSKDNEKYLRTLWNGQPNTAGSIFLEGANAGWEDLHLILYGHNMRNRSMFGNLREYRSEEFFRQNGGWFTLYTPENGIWRYQIFGVKQVKDDSPLYTVGFCLGQDYSLFLKSMLEGRLYETGVTLYSEDHVMTLSTCVGDDDQRLVVMARRAEEVQP